MNTEPERIVFYDGDCGFCNTSVQFILDKGKEDFYFATLQSEFAKEKLAEHDIQIKMDTLYYLKKGKIHERSGAALRIAKGLKGGYPLLFGFIIIPPFIRNWCYDMIAARRHRIKAGFCKIPTEKEKKFFIAQ